MVRRLVSRSALVGALFGCVARPSFGAPEDDAALARPPSQIEATAPQLDAAAPTLEGPGKAALAADAPLVAVHVETEGRLWATQIASPAFQPGQPLTATLARDLMRQLLDTGRFASARAEAISQDSGALLVIWVVPRRVVLGFEVSGSRVQDLTLTRETGLGAGEDVTEAKLRQIEAAIARLHARQGYLDAQVTIAAEPTDDPLGVRLKVNVKPGAQATVEQVIIRLEQTAGQRSRPGQAPSIPGIRPGVPADAEQLEREAELFQGNLVAQGYLDAQVRAELLPDRTALVHLATGPQYRITFEGNHTFDKTALETQIDLAESKQHSVDYLNGRIRSLYVQHGFLDATVRTLRFEVDQGRSVVLRMTIQEGERVLVRRRDYLCLNDPRLQRLLDPEVDGTLAEHFPGELALDSAIPGVLDQELNGRRTLTPSPLTRRPFETFSEEAYQAAAEHLTQILESEGYLQARTSPPVLLRQACAPGTLPSACNEPPPPAPADFDCAAEPALTPPACQSRPGRPCSTEAAVALPVRPGPLALLSEIAIDGNERFAVRELEAVLGLELGSPARRAAIDVALRQLKELYLEEGYAFVEITSHLELSEDGTRARLNVSIAEHKQVHISRVVIEGAERTREALIRKRVLLGPGSLYRQSLVKRSERQIEDLGVFTSVSVGLEDPNVPAREKVLRVSVAERQPQYLDIKGGFSSGDGFRIGFEYGHRNLLGEAVQFYIRSQLGLRPPFLLVEPDVRARYERLDLGTLMERRNTLTLSLPETGLGPAFRFEVEAMDVRVNQRDYSQVRDAGELRLLFQPSDPWHLSLHGTVELNDVTLLALVGAVNREALIKLLQENSSIRVPQGQSVAFAQRIEATWDKRDKALAPSQGVILGLGLEHVTALPTDAALRCNPDAEVFDPTCSELLRLTGRATGYLPLTNDGLVLAMGLRGGVIQHLTNDSRTYPDRLFFMGGIGTLRGFPQDSLVPQDIAERLLDPESGLTIQNVVLRGGDVFINPRLELRIPLPASLETAIFVDSGNVWADRNRFDALRLRYTVGTGLRYQTPVGPLILDYGFNVDRVLDAVFPDRPNQRTWEAIGSFHFSIGYF